MLPYEERLANWLRACRYEQDPEVVAMRKYLPLVVGEAPNRDGDGTVPAEIFAAGRLASVGDVARFERCNLLREWPGAQGAGSAFPMKEARKAAASLLKATEGERGLILVGTRVALAFGLHRRHYEYLEWFGMQAGWGRMVAVCPHPSGLNRWWNDPENVEQARQFFADVLAEATCR